MELAEIVEFRVDTANMQYLMTLWETGLWGGL